MKKMNDEISFYNEFDYDCVKRQLRKSKNIGVLIFDYLFVIYNSFNAYLIKINDWLSKIENR